MKTIAVTILQLKQLKEKNLKNFRLQSSISRSSLNFFRFLLSTA